MLLTRTDLDSYVTVLLEERRLAVSTARRRMAVTSPLFTWAVDEGVLDRHRCSPDAPTTTAGSTRTGASGYRSGADVAGP